MRYLGLHFDPQLKFHEHIKTVASKASRATEALRMLGNSTRGLNQLYLRQLYLGAILPIATYGSIAFWDGSLPHTHTTLEHMQNKALCTITGAFKTTPIRALKIEALIPPIDITLDYLAKRYAKRALKLTSHNPIISHIPENMRHPTHTAPPPTPPPLP